MQTKKAKYHLKRIETILNLHDGNISRLDRDILLEDIRHLYDLVLNVDDAQPDKELETPRDHTYVKPTEIPIQKEPEQQIDPINQGNQENSSSTESLDKSKIEVHEEPKEPVPEIKQEAERIHTPTTVTYEKTSENVEENSKEAAYMESSSSDKMNGRSQEASSVPTQAEEYDDVMVEESAGYPELFDFHSSSDLSERLANSKIENLNKILTINDKILYINHLFSGEAIPFQESLKKFESFYTYEEAKKYASEELVENYNWTKSEKKDTVQQFMRQVKRLY